MLNTLMLEMSMDDIGDKHLVSSIATPLKEDAFLKSDDEKVNPIAYLFKEIKHSTGTFKQGTFRMK